MYIQGRNIYVGDPSLGNVQISNGTHVIFDAAENCYLENGFECELGSIFEIKKKRYKEVICLNGVYLYKVMYTNGSAISRGKAVVH